MTNVLSFDTVIVDGHEHFGGRCYIHLQSERIMSWWRLRWLCKQVGWSYGIWPIKTTRFKSNFPFICFWLPHFLQLAYINDHNYFGIWVKDTPWLAYAGTDDRQRNSCKQFETQQWKMVGEKHYSFAVLPLGKTWCPMWKRLGGFQELVWTAWKVLPPTGLYPWTVQSIAILYINKAIQTAILQLPRHYSLTLKVDTACFSEKSFSTANHAWYQYAEGYHLRLWILSIVCSSAVVCL